MNRVKEKLLLFLATLSFNETSSNEGELDDQAHEVASDPCACEMNAAAPSIAKSESRKIRGTGHEPSCTFDLYVIGQMALATLKEEARANAFANLDDEEEELVVTEGALMDLVNELRFV